MIIPGTVVVAGFCPMGCGQYLVASLDTGQVRCIAEDCPERFAVDRILADPETEHVVTLEPGSYSVKHPLRERLDDGLLTCALVEHIVEFGPEYLADGALGVFGGAIPAGVPHRVRWVGEGEDVTTEWEQLT